MPLCFKMSKRKQASARDLIESALKCTKIEDEFTKIVILVPAFWISLFLLMPGPTKGPF